MNDEQKTEMLIDACKMGLRFLDSLPTTTNALLLENRNTYRRLLTDTLTNALNYFLEVDQL